MVGSDKVNSNRNSKKKKVNLRYFLPSIHPSLGVSFIFWHPPPKASPIWHQSRKQTSWPGICTPDNTIPSGSKVLIVWADKLSDNSFYIISKFPSGFNILWFKTIKNLQYFHKSFLNSLMTLSYLSVLTVFTRIVPVPRVEVQERILKGEGSTRPFQPNGRYFLNCWILGSSNHDF